MDQEPVSGDLAATRPARAGGAGLGALTSILGWRYAVTAIIGSALAAVVIGVPTDVLPNPWFTRMTPVRTLDVVLLPLTSILLGALLATYVASATASPRRSAGAGMLGGMLGWFAVGCPICNKLVVALLGVSGALNYFGPLQPLLGIASVLLVAWALRVRMRALLVGCPLPPAIST